MHYLCSDDCKVLKKIKPMRKFTLILTFILCGIAGIQSQKNSTLFDKNTTETSNTQSTKTSESDVVPKFTVTGKTLNVSNMDSGVQIDIYSALGAKVLTTVYNGTSISLVNLNKGIYIVRAGKFTQKIML